MSRLPSSTGVTWSFQISSNLFVWITFFPYPVCTSVAFTSILYLLLPRITSVRCCPDKTHSNTSVECTTTPKWNSGIPDVPGDREIVRQIKAVMVTYYKRLKQQKHKHQKGVRTRTCLCATPLWESSGTSTRQHIYTSLFLNTKTNFGVHIQSDEQRVGVSMSLLSRYVSLGPLEYRKM